MPRVAASERDAFVEKRRSELVEAALGLFAEQGYDRATVEAIARRAGLSKGSFYVYFPSKRALLERAVQQHSLRMPLEETLAKLADAPLEQLVPILARAVWQHFGERRHLILVLLRELPSHLDLAEHFVATVILPINRRFAEYLETRVGAERARKLDLLIAGRGLIGMLMVNFLLQEVLGGAKHADVPSERLLQTVSELFLHGIRGSSSA